jgi:hypothetical protein
MSLLHERVHAHLYMFYQMLATYVGTSSDAAFDFPTFSRMCKDVMRGRRLDTAVSGGR